MDTIFALATAQGRAGVAVIRISGPRAFDVAQRLMGDVPKSRGVRRLVDHDGLFLDEALVLHFAGGHSFTGEDVIELHLHGSIAVVAAVLSALGLDPDTRHAEAGEFTRRALDNGKLDLTQVEGLADLIDAETEGQRKQALRVLSGELGTLASGWRDKLLRAAALIEATIDFADEEVPVDVGPEVVDLLEDVRRDLIHQADGVTAAERLRHGFEVAILGAPNAGKSTLINKLAGRNAAITSAIAGTTRDVIEVKMDLSGMPVTFLDTAGLRDTSDEIEAIGIARAKERAEGADLRIYLLSEEDAVQIALSEDDILVNAKADLGEGEGLDVSGLTGLGVEKLVDEVTNLLAKKVAMVGVAMRERHRVAMRSCVFQIDLALDALLTDGYFADLVAEDLRVGLRSIDGLIGRIGVEDVLGEIFSSFCIGK